MALFTFQIEAFAFLYGFIAIAYILNNMVQFIRVGRQTSVLQKLLPFLVIMKMLYCLLNYAFWTECPWSIDNEAINFMKSFRVTIATVFQTMFCLCFITMAIGYKVCKHSLSEREIKKILLVTSSQYCVDSLYSIGQYLPQIGKITTLGINLFSVIMIFMVLHETKKNFSALNFRMHVITEFTPQLWSLRHAIVQRKKIISAIALTIIFYFIVEVLVHGIWDVFLLQSYGTIQNQLRLWVFHETVDLMTLCMLLGLSLVSSRSFLDSFETIIDVSNTNYKDEILKAKNAVVLLCSVSASQSFQGDILDEQEERDLRESLKFDIPIMIVNPCLSSEDGRGSDSLKLGYIDTTPDKPPSIVHSSLSDSVYETTEAASERNVLVSDQTV